MAHPFDALKSEYSYLLSMMTVRQECVERVNTVAVKILGFRTRFEEITKQNGVPVIFMGPSFYREANLDFTKNPAQGWPLSSRSRIIPHNGPFRDWASAAIAAYHLNGLDKIGAENWTWELICFYAELFNGFGYRDYHHMHSPYLWGGTNIQTIGKYTSDGKFDPDHMDEQMGVIPVAKMVAKLAPELDMTLAPIAAPMPSGIAVSDKPTHDVTWVQTVLHDLGFNIAVDGSYGQETRSAVSMFQTEYGVHDLPGYAMGPTLSALEQAYSEFKASDKPAVPALPAPQNPPGPPLPPRPPGLRMG